MGVSMRLGEAFIDLTARTGSLQGTLGAAGGMVAGALGSIPGIGAAAGASVKVLTAIAESLFSAVEKANPALMNQMNLAWDDLQAAIGQGVMPVFERLLPVVQQLGDVFASAAPYIGVVVEQMGQLMDVAYGVGQVIGELLGDLGISIPGRSAAGLSGSSRASMGSIGGAGQSAMVAALNASAGYANIEQKQEVWATQIIALFKEQIQGFKDSVLKFL